MQQQNIKNKKGFTIIEVVLVLAIAGLIFMMVFTALPALQRSQRDTQRGTDFQRLTAALQQYQSNNRGRIPTDGNYVEVKEVEVGTGDDKALELKVTVDGEAAASNGSFASSSWGYFYEKYLTVNSAGSNDTFEDPDGEPYAFIINDCNPAEKTGGTACDDSVQRNNVTFDAQSEGTSISDDVSVGHAISVVKNATCDGELAVYSSGSRRVAMLYKKEGGGTFCYSI